MELPAQQESNSGTNSPWIKATNIVLPLFAMALGIVVGFVAYPLISGSFLQKETPQQISGKNFPIGLDVLQNPVVNQWSGAVEGTLTAKNSTSFTLSKAGHSITILVDPEGTKFFTRESVKKGIGEQFISLNDIPLDSHLRGSFLVIPRAGDKNRIVGSSFMITE